MTRSVANAICYSGSSLGIRARVTSLVAWGSRRQAKTIMLVLTALSFFSAETTYIWTEEVPSEIKQQLFQRYDQKNLNVISDHILVALLLEGPGFNGRGRDRLEYSVNYEHVDAHTPKDRWPKRSRIATCSMNIRPNKLKPGRRSQILSLSGVEMVTPPLPVREAVNSFGEGAGLWDWNTAMVAAIRHKDDAEDYILDKAALALRDFKGGHAREQRAHTTPASLLLIEGGILLGRF